MNKILICLMLLTTCAMKAETTNITFQSGPEQTTLLELYTSEGCSSCPPAEKWLSGLKESPGLWKDFVPVAFHVDYWDHLGWRDPFSDRGFSDRQMSYAEVWHSENVYTPAFVLNGKEWEGWRLRKDVPKQAVASGGILKVASLVRTGWQVSFQPAGLNTDSYEVHAALLVSGVGSDVKAGENRGRHLKHDFAALNFVTIPLKPEGELYRGQFVLSPPDGKSTADIAIAVWVTRKGSLESVQATGGWITQ